MMKKIDVSKWGEFVIGELFKISRPVARSQAKYNDGDVAFVASGNIDNGVVKWCQPKDNEKLDEGNCITVSPLDGSSFYQKDAFLGRGGAGSAILILRNEKLSEFAGLFIVVTLRRALTKYSYSDQLNSQTIAVEKIKLPITESGEPNWDYMNSYMCSKMSEADSIVSELSNIISGDSVLSGEE